MNDKISYAHKADPKGTRYVSMKTDTLPAWAVDVVEVDACLNAYGLPYHPTDTYVHWREKDPICEMNKIRAIYDQIINAGVTPKQLEELLQVAYYSGRDDQADNDNPDL